MRFISCHDGKLQTLETAGLKASPDRSFVNGLAAWDALAPQKCFARGAVHELLFDGTGGAPIFVASVLAQSASILNDFGAGLCESGASRSDERLVGSAVPNVFSCPQKTFGTAEPTAAGTERRMIAEGNVIRLRESASLPEAASLLFGQRTQEMPVIWSDPRGEIYPPALAALGFDLTRTYLLRTINDADEAWAVAECLRCRGVGAVIAQPSASRRMSRIEARRLQLAAETGGSVGILLRQTGQGDNVYAAATRWHVSPLAGEPTVQRWTIRLLHGHGGRIGQSLILEWRRERENHLVRAIEQLADRPAATPASRATA
jgi:hypothetical protein